MQYKTGYCYTPLISMYCCIREILWPPKERTLLVFQVCIDVIILALFSPVDTHRKEMHAEYMCGEQPYGYCLIDAY